MQSKKVVQTELTTREYELLLSAAKSRHLTIKNAAKEAIVQWAASSADLTDDPLIKLKPVAFRVKVGIEEIDKILYKA